MSRIITKTRTGNIISDEELGLEYLYVGDYGKENNIKASFLGYDKRIDKVEHKDVVLEDKLVVTVSSQKGCPMKCNFCDCPKLGFHGNVSKAELISEITNYTSVVLGKSSSDNKLKKVEVIPLDNYKILTMLITDKGYVEYKNLYLPETDIDEVTKTVNLINKMIIGTPINEISEKLEYDVKPIIGQYVKQHEVLYNAFYDAFSNFTNKASDVHFAGKNNFLKQPEFSNIEKVKEILNKFDEIESINDLDDEENGIKIHIGKDSELSEDVSVIKTKYNYNGEEGTIAIIGPKRMEYERVVNLLNYIKENIDNENK